MKKVLIIEDDERISQLEQDYLMASGFETDAARDGSIGLERALTYDYDIILLDIMLPGISGLDICRAIREKKNIPIIMISAKKEDMDKIKGLGYGADDYIVKPFSPSELVARVIAHINRYERLTAAAPTADAAASGNADMQRVIEIDFLRLEPASRKVFVNSKEVMMTNKEFDLLYFLAQNPDTVYSKDELFDKIWNYESIGETSTITVHINRIRDKIKEIAPSAECIHTVWGRGYRFR